MSTLEIQAAEISQTVRVEAETARACREDLAARLHWLGDIIVQRKVPVFLCELTDRSLGPVFSSLERAGERAPFTGLSISAPRPLLERVSRGSWIRFLATAFLRRRILRVEPIRRFNRG